MITACLQRKKPKDTERGKMYPIFNRFGAILLRLVPSKDKKLIFIV